MKLAAWGRWGLVGAGIGAMLAAIVLLVIEARLPEMRDVEGFERAVTDLYDLAKEDGNFRRASQKFFELRIAQDNSKAFMADLGGCLLVCGFLLTVLAWRLPQSTRLRRLVLHTHRFAIVALIGLAAACLFGVGATVQLLTNFERFEYPPWADTMAIPLAGISVLTVLACIFVLVFAGLPHILRRPRGAPLLAAPRLTAGNIIALLVYGSLALFFAFVAVVMIGAPGSWLLTPVMLVFAWLMLHARAVASA